MTLYMILFTAQCILLFIILVLLFVLARKQKKLRDIIAENDKEIQKQLDFFNKSSP